MAGEEGRKVGRKGNGLEHMTTFLVRFCITLRCIFGVGSFFFLPGCFSLCVYVAGVYDIMECVPCGFIVPFWSCHSVILAEFIMC